MGARWLGELTGWQCDGWTSLWGSHAQQTVAAEEVGVLGGGVDAGRAKGRRRSGLVGPRREGRVPTPTHSNQRAWLPGEPAGRRRGVLAGRPHVGRAHERRARGAAARGATSRTATSGPSTSGAGGMWQGSQSTPHVSQTKQESRMNPTYTTKQQTGSLNSKN